MIQSIAKNHLAINRQAVEGCIVRAYVVIVSTHSLFAEGVASRLRQYLEQTQFNIVDPRQPDAMVQITAAQPSIVILDVTDPEATRLCSLSNLLLSLPKLKVIRLDLQHDQVQVVTSEQRSVVAVRDLVDVIQPVP